MSAETKRSCERWHDDYTRLLHSYLDQPSEETLRRCGALVRSLVEVGVVSRDAAAAHLAGIAARCARRGGEGWDATRAAQPMLAALLEVYDDAFEQQRRLNRHLEGRTRRLRRVAEELRRSRDELRQSEMDFRVLVENARDGILVAARDGRYVYANNCAAALTGYAVEELVATGTRESLTAAGEPCGIRERCRTRSNGEARLERYETSILRKDGQRVFVEVTAAPAFWQGEPVLLEFLRDVTERKQVEETLRRQALVFDHIHDAVIVTDRDARITEWNPGAERVFGYTRDAALGRSVSFFYAPDAPADLNRRLREAAWREGQWSGEIRFVRRDGTEGLCEVIVVALRDEKEEFVGTVGVASDISDRRRAEEEARRRREELAHVARLATIGELATGLAHELNQPLAAILYYARGCARRLRTGGWDLEQLLGVIDKVAVQAERAGSFIARFRDFTRKSKPRLLPVDLNEVVREAVGFAEHEVRENRVEIDLQLDTGLPHVLADMVQIEQVILNVLRNGIEAMQDTRPGERRLTIQTSNAGNDTVECAVADTGCGLSEDAADRLFDAFFSTKTDGLGMGLAISRSIIEAHGGRLWAGSNPDGGTKFRFTLPTSGGGASHAE